MNAAHTFFRAFTLLLLVALIAGAGVGYFFFSAWQKDARPEVTAVRWDREGTALAAAATLEVEVRAPWHRELKSPLPGGRPDHLIPVAGGAKLTRGTAGLDGFRTWTITLPMVATSLADIGGQPLTFPLVPTRRLSPNSITTALPLLEITSPENLPTTPSNPTDLLRATDPPPVVPQAIAEKESTPIPWALIAGAIVALAAASHLLRRLLRKPATPPWTTALADLEKLQRQNDLPHPAFFSRLTDILKHYTTARFDISATAETSSELLESLHPHLPGQHAEDIPALIRQADAIKFAKVQTAPPALGESLTLIRTFVTQTTPSEER